MVKEANMEIIITIIGITILILIVIITSFIVTSNNTKQLKENGFQNIYLDCSESNDNSIREAVKYLKLTNGIR